MSGTLHRRIRASLSTLDAFPKTEDTYQTRTTSGGILTLVLTLFLAVLTLAEFADYRRLEQKYEFLVDQSSGNAKHKLQINVDVTLAMKCEYLTLDVVDVGGTSLHVKHALRSDASTFSVQDAHQLGEGSADPLDIHRLIKQAQKSSKKNYGAGEGTPGCRVYGSFDVNKVMGNLHITALGHGYGGHHVPHNAINFTHRVDKLSFGLDYPGLVNPLDNSVEIAKENFQQFQYYISVVPTIYIDYSGTVLLTNQYAVTDYKRTISHDGGTGLPGIFFKYDIEAILVRISETRPTFLQFLVRVCGIVGGLFATAGMAHKIAGSILQQTRKIVEEKGSSNFR